MAKTEQETIEEKDADKFKSKSIGKISQIIAAINPERYSTNSKEVRKLIDQGKFWEAVSKVKAKSGQEYFLSYNSTMESLEPVYFWILDFLGGPSKVEKLVDNFQSSPGSGHFSEMMMKGTRMQEEAMKVMQTIGVLIKSIINIVYDLRQFEIRLNDYKAAKDEKDKSRAEAGLMALKQVWMDNVDIKRGNTSIKAMAFSQASFATLIDAFMMAKSSEHISNNPEQGGLDLNERVKNILKQRFLEFQEWKRLSEKELEKRFSIQKSWLKSQVDSLKLYSRWARPYLKAAEELRMSMSPNAALVKAFNTNVMELTLLKKDAVKIEEEVVNKNLPRDFDKLVEEKKIRPTFSCVLVDFNFTGIPQRVDQHYGFGGKSDVTFKAYALNNEEIDELKKRLDESDVQEALKLVEGATSESLGAIEEDIKYFLEGKEREDEEAGGEEKSEDVNPFTALLGIGGKKEKKKAEKDKEEKDKKIKKDSYAEKVVREFAELGARKNCFTVYDIYKKSHGMASVPFGDLFEKKDVKVIF